MERTVWIVIAVVALAVAGFFGYRAYDLSQKEGSGQGQSAELQKKLSDAQAMAKDAAKRADTEAEARRLFELKSKEEAEAEARRLAQTDRERQEQEAARKRAEEDAAKASAELDRIRAEKRQLETEAQRLTELRERERAEAQARLAAAQRALEESERRKNAEIERQAALIASYNRSPSPVESAANERGSAEASDARRTTRRVIFPSSYKRAVHYYLPLLPSSEPGGD